MIKKIVLILLFAFVFIFNTNAQFPLTQTLGSPNTQVYSKGGLGADSGFVFRMNFPDTSVLNIGFLKNIPGLQIRVGDNIWMRNNAATAWIRLGGIVPAYNGLSYNSGDSLRIGGVFSDSITHLQLAVGSKTGQSTFATSKVYVLSNKSLAEDLVTSDWNYWLKRGANTLQWYQRLFYESDNDTAAQQYNAIVNGFNRYTLDFNSSRFDSANGRTINMQYAGAYFINQLYPTKNIVISPSSFGRDGSTFAGALAFGKDSAYTITLSSSSSTPWPLTVYHSEIDFNRAVPSNKSRIFRTGGVGIGNYTAGWKSYQSSLGAADTLNPSYIGLVYGFKAQGSIYSTPFNGSGFTKSRILARSMLDTFVAFWAPTLYTQSNEVRNGFAFWNQGSLDWNYYAGLSRFGGGMPDRATGDTIAHVSEFFGNVLMDGTNNLRFRAATTGLFPGMFWQIKDTSGSQGNIDYNSASSRDSRGLIIGSGTSSSATAGYDNNGPGFYIDLRTGNNGVNATRMFRNGHTVFGSQSGINNYRNISKVVVVGDMTVTDTMFLRRTPLITSGSGLDVILRNRSDSALYALPYDSLHAGATTEYFARNDARNNTGNDMYFSAAGYNLVIDSIKGEGDSYNRYIDAGNNFDYITGFYGGNSFYQITAINNSSSYFSTIELQPTGVNISSTEYGSRVQVSDSLVLKTPHFSSDTTKYKPLAIDSIGNSIRMNYWPSGSGTTPGIDDVLAVGQLLTANRSINQNTHNLFFLGGGYFRVYDAAGTNRLLEIDGSGTSGFIGNGTGLKQFSFTSDSLFLIGLGQKIDTTIWKPTVRNVNTGALAYAPWMYAGGSGSVTISSLLAATATNTINNADYQQEWQWNTLSSNSALKLSSTSTAATSSTQKLLEISLSGANSNSGQSTYGIDVSNTHTGTTSLNTGIRSTATGATNNRPFDAIATESNATAHYYMTGTGNRAGWMGLGVANYVLFMNMHSSDNTAGFSFRSRTSTEIFSISSTVVSAPFSLVVNDANGNFNSRIEGQTDVNLFNTIASSNSVGIGTATHGGAKLAVGGATTSGVIINGTWTTGNAFSSGGSITPSAGNNGIMSILGGAITEASSGNHTLLANVALTAPLITGGSATVTNTANLYINNALATTVTGGNYALWVDDGTTRLDGGLNLNIRTVTGTTTAAEDFTILCDATSGAITINLPAASTVTGRIYNVKKIDNSINTVTVDPNSTETIDGASTNVIATQWTNIQFQSNGTNWFIL